MRILVISARPPSSLTDGAWLCAYNIFKRLSADHDIYLISFYENSHGRPQRTKMEDIFRESFMVKLEMPRRPLFRYLKNVLSWKSGMDMKQQFPEMYSQFKKKMAELIISKNIDVIHCLMLKMAEFAFDMDESVRVLHLIDSQTLRMQRLLSLQSMQGRLRKLRQIIHYYRLRTVERNALGYFDSTITVGKKDYEILKGLLPGKSITLIPNGVDTDYFYRLPKEDSEGPIIIFFGKMTTPPNIEAVMYFYHDIFPILKEKITDLHFYIVGESPPDRIKRLSTDRDIIVTGYVDDIRKYVAKADVVICPMIIGGGIKNKILEAMSMGRAVVSTSLGAEGVDVTNGENILISDSPVEFAESIDNLIRDKGLRDRITNNARELINGRYSWEICAKKYEQLYISLLDRRIEKQKMQIKERAEWH
jgi:glycosyltransferase involved in cell wall biosynthesis